MCTARTRLLDEATSALDTETESAIQENLFRASNSPRRTLVIIAHRLTTVQNCDRIIVLEGGAVCEQGSHEELLARRGRYFELAKRMDVEGDSGSTVS